jgi:putative Mg2+ transporter-C (MgtC) family protein
MALVAMGASAFTVVSAYGFVGFDKYDASRMAASVASGVGFVGAGVITTTASDKSQNVVHGLTTAATIWWVNRIVGHHSRLLLLLLLLLMIVVAVLYLHVLQ